mgnify:CR=1 FL=1
MLKKSKNSFQSLDEIKVSSKTYKIFNLKKAEQNGLEGISKLPKSLKVLLENLNEEEDRENDHPKLWKNFALAMGADSKEIETKPQEKFTSEMIENFFKQARSSYAEGLGSFFTYERQVPEIAETKIQGLKKHYGVTTEEGLMFFEVHKGADVVHREECEKLLNELTEAEQKKS